MRMVIEVSKSPNLNIVACDSATQYYRQQQTEKERFDAISQENEEFWRRVKNLEKPYSKSKLNSDFDKAKDSIWSDKCLLQSGLFEYDIDHSTCVKCCKHSSDTIVKRRYRWRKQKVEWRKEKH